MGYFSISINSNVLTFGKVKVTLSIRRWFRQSIRRLRLFRGHPQEPILNKHLLHVFIIVDGCVSMETNMANRHGYCIARALKVDFCKNEICVCLCAFGIMSDMCCGIV